MKIPNEKTNQDSSRDNKIHIEGMFMCLAIVLEDCVFLSLVVIVCNRSILGVQRLR